MSNQPPVTDRRILRKNLFSCFSLITFLLIVESPSYAESLLPTKWFPGHYLYATDHTNHLGITTKDRNLIKNNKNFVGYHGQYWWHRLEPTKGNYDFTMILEDLDKAHSDGKKLSVKFYDRIFSLNRPFPVPEYLTKDPVYEGGVYTSGTKILPKLWVPAMTERYVLLHQAMARAIDKHPALSAILLEETALTGRETQKGYSDQKYHDALVRINSAASTAFIETPVFQLANYGLPEDLRTSLMYEIVEVNKNGIGGPDTYNNDGGALEMAFGPFYTKYDGIAPKYASVEASGYQTAFNMRQVFEYGVDKLKLNFMAWTPRTSDWGPKGYTIDDAIAVINQENGRINTRPPQNINSGPRSRPTAPTDIHLE